MVRSTQLSTVLVDRSGPKVGWQLFPWMISYTSKCPSSSCESITCQLYFNWKSEQNLWIHHHAMLTSVMPSVPNELYTFLHISSRTVPMTFCIPGFHAWGALGVPPQICACVHRWNLVFRTMVEHLLHVSKVLQCFWEFHLYLKAGWKVHIPPIFY